MVSIRVVYLGVSRLVWALSGGEVVYIGVWVFKSR